MKQERLQVVAFITLCLVAASSMATYQQDQEMQRRADIDKLWARVKTDSKTPQGNDAKTSGARSGSGGCITRLIILARTGDLTGAGFNSNVNTHQTVLMLKSGKQLCGDIKGPAYSNSKYTSEMDFAKGFNTRECVQQSDVKLVSLVAGEGNNWYITDITISVKVGTGPYKELTTDPIFNKWLDSDSRRYSYDSTNLVLSLGSKDTPQCGYGVPVCECKETARVCIFNLEIDEVRTFTSYRKFPAGEGDGMFVRGAQGVLYNIDEADGIQKPLKRHEGRHCAENNPTDCTEPQFIDGKSYRLAIAVNGQVPGPTIIIHHKQEVVIHVHNNLTVEGISIHWHGMHQIGTPWMDGVGQVTQCQIGPASSFTYFYTGSPSGTFWYHSHSGIQRTDGFFGALIVKERPRRLKIIEEKLGLGKFEDLPGEHSISLIDWMHEPALDTISQLNAGLGYYVDAIGEVPSDNSTAYSVTFGYERIVVGPVPYFSGLINGKGRHENVHYAKTRLSVFTVEENKRYRFRLIGAQGLYAYKFYIDGHKLTVVSTDGYWIEPVKKVDYIIIHTGERYDFILEANAKFGNYWIRAETLEINIDGSVPPFESLGHVAEAILQYKRSGQDAPTIPSTDYENIKSGSQPASCTKDQKCTAVNCPFKNFHESYYTDCINVNEMKLLEDTPPDQMPQESPSLDCPDCLKFINFNFEGDSDTSSVNGRNFILPPVPPQTQNADFQEQATQCSISADCNPSTLDCMCTHVIDIPYDKTIQFVLTSIGGFSSVHPLHLHGHTFHVVHVGYPEYDPTTGFIDSHSKDIQCNDTCEGKPPGCNPVRCTRPGWKDGEHPSFSIDRRTIRKDTLMVPAGGYVVINFISDNPGHWFLHCHIEMHQIQGMAVIINEAFEQQKAPPQSMNKCGDVRLSMGEYEAEGFSKLIKQKSSTHRYSAGESLTFL